MRYIFIMMALFSLTTMLFSKDMSHQRAQMLLQGKHLTKRYDSLIHRQEAWQERKKVLIERFDTSHAVQTDFGVENRYGSQRKERRSSEFYASLEKRENEIVEELFAIEAELNTLREEFSHLFGVPLTRKEMFSGTAPKVIDKKRKVRLLQKYLNFKRSWESCLNAVDRFDQKRVSLEMRPNLSERRYDTLSKRLDEKVEKNFVSLSRYEEKSIGALDTYALDYGYSIPDEYAARILLENIRKSR